MRTAEQMRRTEIKRLEQKRWLFKFIAYVITVLTILTLLYFNAKLNNQPIGQPVRNIVEHKVKYYEHNLTQIANKYYPDVRLDKAIADIKKLNNMQESDIYVGQVLKLEVR